MEKYQGQPFDHRWRPLGGIGIFTEVFNLPGYFNPDGFVEVCSIMSWLQLNGELLIITGDAQYADELERTLYNDLLGAMNPNGEDWCYFVHPNGQKKNTYYWACCKSSGALALEEIPPLVVGRLGEGITVNLYCAGDATVTLPSAGAVTVHQVTDYPRNGRVEIAIDTRRDEALPLALRIPSWAAGTSLFVNGIPAKGEVLPGRYFTISRKWTGSDKVVIKFPMKPRIVVKSDRTVQDGTREISRTDYFSMEFGPLVYSTRLIDGFKREETILLPQNVAERFAATKAPDGCAGPAFHLRLDYRSPILYLPYFEAAGAGSEGWRLTWHSFVPE